MRKCLLILGAFITGCATIMQLWLSGIVFNNDYQCRTLFYSSNTSIGNKMQCINSLNSTLEWHCACRVEVINYNGDENIDCWLKISNDWAVYLASLHVFIPLVIVECIRALAMLFTICGDVHSFSTFEYFSVFGFFVMLLDPTIFHNNIPSSRIESALILIDTGTIVLIFQYTSVINVAITDPFYLVTLIASCCNGLRCILIIYYLNRQRYIKMKKQGLLKSVCADNVVQPPAYDVLKPE